MTKPAPKDRSLVKTYEIHERLCLINIENVRTLMMQIGLILVSVNSNAIVQLYFSFVR